MTKKAVLYTRISRDVEGSAAGVDRQRKDCAALCKRRGWDVAEVLVDNDFSAYSGKKRPGYARLLELVEGDEVDVLVAWHPDRLHRSPKELEHFVELVEAHRVQVATVTAGDVDLATPEGRLMARITGAVARKESEDKSRRLRRKHRELAEKGKLAGGGVRPFGFADDRIKHNPAEVRRIREAAQRVLAGESLYAIANDWNDNGVATVTGAKWTTTHLRSFLLAPRVAGLRQSDGDLFEAVWKPVLDRETWEQVGRVLRTRSRKRTRPARVYPLSGGVARCGECGAALVAAPRPTGRAYACLVSHGGCNRVSIMADPVEGLVFEAVFEAVDSPAFEKAMVEADHTDDEADEARAELAKLEQRRRELAEMYAEGEVGRKDWQMATARLDERQAELEAAAVADVNPLAAVKAKQSLRKAWPKMSVDQQRTVLGTVLEAVVVVSGRGAGGRKVDLSRVDLRWKV